MAPKSCFRSEWYGKRVSKTVRAAQRKALVDTAAECVRKAVPRAPIKYGVLRRSIKVGDVIEDMVGIRVQWGSFDVNYALAQERGTGRRPGKFFLLSAADEEYPKIGERIKVNLR